MTGRDHITLPLTASADGWRGLIGKSFTKRTASILANSAFEILCPLIGNRILVAYDGRKNGKDAASSILKVAQTHQAELILAPHLPTPIAAAMLYNDQVDIAIIITASHNPATWNGVKIKAGRHGSVSGDLEKKIDTNFQQAIASSPILPDGASASYVTLLSDNLTKDHCDRLVSKIGFASLSGQKIVIDGLGGVAGTPVATLCRSLGAEVILIGGDPTEHFDGCKPDPTLGASQQRCKRLLKEKKGQLGIILDGDGDRIVLVSRDGQNWQGQEVLAALFDSLPAKTIEKLDGPLIITSSTGMLIRRMGEKLGKPIIETPIGFKHIVKHMNALPNSVGVGAVGDYGFQCLGSDRDPFALILLLAQAFPDLEKLAPTIDALRRRFHTEKLHWFEERWALPDDSSLQVAVKLLQTAVLNAEGKHIPCADGDRYELADGQWTLIRPSTTEGGIRLYGEFNNHELGYGLLEKAQQQLIGTNTSRARCETPSLKEAL